MGICCLVLGSLGAAVRLLRRLAGRIVLHDVVRMAFVPGVLTGCCLLGLRRARYLCLRGSSLEQQAQDERWKEEQFFSHVY